MNQGIDSRYTREMSVGEVFVIVLRRPPISWPRPRIERSTFIGAEADVWIWEIGRSAMVRSKDSPTSMLF